MVSVIKDRREPNPNSFIAIRRQIKSDVLSGKLSHNEFKLLSWLFQLSDMYGKVTANINSLRDDMFPKIQAASVAKTLKSLRSKKYIDYQSHQGKAGSFEVRLDYWLIKYGVWRRLDGALDEAADESVETSATNLVAEASLKSASRSQEFLEKKAQLLIGFGSGNSNPQIRSAYTETHNENETEKEKLNIDGKNNSFNIGRMPLDTFEPSNGEELRCKEIALKIGETYMDFLLSVLRRHGISLIERALGLYVEQANVSTINDPPAYLNKIIQQLVLESGSKDEVAKDIEF